MVSNKLAELGNTELAYIQKILGEKLQQENEQNKTWQAKNSERPFQKSNMILRCLNAVSAQQRLNERMTVKW